MRSALWPETADEDHRKEMSMMLSEPDRFTVFVCEDAQGSLVGFTEVSLRVWAEGCRSSPVGYLEGWYVAPHAREKGVGTDLIAASEDWARSRGCTEMASDTELGNAASEAAHQKLGYEVACTMVAFRKALP